MTRREAISLAAAGISLPNQVRAAEPPGSSYRDYSRCLPDYLSSLARVAYEKRNRAIAALTSGDAIRKRQRWATETFLKLIGGLPERTPLNARVTGTLEREGYRLEKVVYESRPRIFVTANLYVPLTGRPPYPGILFQMGHSLAGKGYASYQKCCQGLARLGYVVLAFDPMGQGERIYYPDASGQATRRASADDEHSYPGKQMLLVGDTASRFQLWDAMRSLDYLASHPQVDAQRLAATGQSGGATLTMMLAAADTRLVAAVISSGNTENVACANFNPPGSTDDAEQDFVNSGPAAFDRWDLLYPMAPKPLLILVSTHDFYGTYSPRYLANGREEYAKLAKVYSTLGRRDHLDWRETPLPHGLTYSLRIHTYNWFERWLKGSTRAIEAEPPVAPEPAEALWTGPKGNVMQDYGSLRPIDLIQERARTIRPSAKTPDVEIPVLGLRFSRVGQTRVEGGHIEAMEVGSAAGVWIPAWIVAPDRVDPGRPALLLLDDRGRNAGVGEGGLYERLSGSGILVCAADVRGIGDTRPEAGRGNPGYTIDHDGEEAFAWSSLILGKSLLSQRAEDILAVTRALKNDPRTGGRRLVIAAKGRLTVPALLAFAAAPLADSLYLAGGLVSFQNLLENEEYRQPLASFEWEMLQKGDLPQLAERAARPIHLAGTVDARGNTMDTSSLGRVYASDRIRFSPTPQWDQQAFEAM
jgi:dienelactone hydrolase